MTAPARLLVVDDEATILELLSGSLTPTEYRLLRFLMANAGRVVSKGEILEHLWEHDPDHGAGRDANAVEPVLSYLRRKVDQGEPRLIHTVRGFGYVLRIPPP